MENKEPIRVLQIVGIACNGGVEAVVLNYYRHMDKSKVQFDFVVHKHPVENFVAEVKKGGGRLYEVTPYTKNIFAFTHEIYRIIKDGHYDIVHSNMNSMSGFPLFAAWLAGAKVRILHNHTTDTKTEGFRTILKRVLRPFAKMFANRYWACSNLAGEWMYGKKAVQSGKITIIPNAIDLEKFAFNPDKRKSLRQKLGLEEKFVLGHIGRFAYQKNHSFLIDVFAEVVRVKPEARLMLIGDGELRKTIEEKVVNLGLQNKVLFLGNRNDVADLYNAMDIFLLPSHYEGLPVVGVEAQANGLKCLFSDKVTYESTLISTTEFIILDFKRWKNIILSLTTYKRYDDMDNNSELMRFDVSAVGVALQFKYRRELNGELT